AAHGRTCDAHCFRHGAACGAFLSKWIYGHDFARGAGMRGADLGTCLRIKGLTKRFGGLVAVNNLDLDLRRGEILGLIGPNGSGKSTVMKCVMGIERPTAGSVQLDNEAIAGLPSHQIARKGLGMVFQHSRPLHRQTVLENIKLALLPDSLVRLFASPEVDKRACEIAASVGLSAVLDRRPSTLPFAD